MYCNNCGFKNNEGTRFCVNCGQQIKQETQQPATGQTISQTGQENQTAVFGTSAQTPSSQSFEPRVSAMQSGQPPIPQQEQPPAWTGQQSAPPQTPEPWTTPPTNTGRTPPSPFPGQAVYQQPGRMGPQAPEAGWQAAPPVWQGQQQAIPPGWQGQHSPTPPPAKKKKKKTGLIIAISLVVLLIAGFLVYSLPLRPRIVLEGARQTLDGSIDDLSLSVKTNQWIQEVRYALDPDDPDDADAYILLEDAEGGIFSKEADLPVLFLDKAVNKSSMERGPWERTDANAKLGNHKLYITVKTVFGTSKPQPFNLLYASGISALPDKTKIRDLKVDEITTSALINELLVSVYMGGDRQTAEYLAEETGGEIVGEIPAISRYQIRYDNASEEEIAGILEDLRNRPEVLTAQYNYIYDRSEVQLYPNDALFDSWDIEEPDGNNWGLEVIRAPLIWKDLDSFTPISIGVADGGLEYGHEDLNINRSNVFLFPTYTMESLDDMELFYAKSKKTPGSDYYGGKEHGTHVTGIISALGDNGIGTAGVNWNTIPYFFHYWHMDVNEETGELDIWNVTTSFELEVTLTTLVEQGCRVINYSIGDGMPSEPGGKHEYFEQQAYGDLCLRLESLGYDFLVFKAAGNESDDAEAYAMNRIMTGTEAARRHTVIVAAIENTPIELRGVDERAKFGYQMSSYSNYGSLVDVAAPGTDVFSTVPNNSYVSMPGTSMASPMAAGVASLIYGAHPEYNASQVKAILMEETDTFTTDGTNLIPVVNAALASDYAKTGDLPIVPPGEIIPNPVLAPYPGPPTPTPVPPPGSIRLPGHTPFQLEQGQAGLAGLVYDSTTKNPVAFFSVYFTGPDGEMVVLDFAYPYPETFDAQLMGEFFTRMNLAQGQEAVVTDFVIEALGYELYEAGSITVRGGEVTSLGTILLTPEDEESVRLPGHTPFFPEEGAGGFSGFVCDAVTKQRIPFFELSANYLGEDFSFSFEYPPRSDRVFAQLEGEFIIWARTDSEDVVENLVFSADGYEPAAVGSVTVRNMQVTDVGIVYLNPIGSPTRPQPTSPAPSNPGITQPRPDPGGNVDALPGQISVVLDWGAKPADLDLHATAPLSEGSKRFHIFAYETYMSYGSAGDPDALMTSDSESAYGSESIVVFKPQPGVPYTFYVHDFTNVAKKSGAWDLSKSGAEVRVYIGESEATVFKVPNKEGTLWEVCTVVDGKITPSNAVSYESRPLNIGS